MKQLTILILLLTLFSCDYIHDHDAEKQDGNGDSGTHPIIGTWYCEAIAESGSGTSEDYSSRNDVHYENYIREYNLTFLEPNIFITKDFYTQIGCGDAIFTGAKLDSLLKSDGVEPPKPDTGTWSISNDTLTYVITNQGTYIDPYWINGDTLLIEMNGEVNGFIRK